MSVDQSRDDAFLAVILDMIEAGLHNVRPSHAFPNMQVLW